ncbi:MAG: hypothetical protein IPJ30_13765 [Acidobacteria bacterium]|nr:hypothetical protein [Acidobacteriota bacterium]
MPRFVFLSVVADGGSRVRRSGKKFFKEGMRASVAEDWDKAVEKFALAVNEDPRNPEYRLHYQRALFMASQQYMKKGNALANEKDYKGGYEMYRRAYGYDPTNELAGKAEMGAYGPFGQKDQPTAVGKNRGTE